MASSSCTSKKGNLTQPCVAWLNTCWSTGDEASLMILCRCQNVQNGRLCLRCFRDDRAGFKSGGLLLCVMGPFLCAETVAHWLLNGHVEVVKGAQTCGNAPCCEFSVVGLGAWCMRFTWLCGSHHILPQVFNKSPSLTWSVTPRCV